ncbi:hypothetical protein TorRG33x02_191000 [Trema orientale]|uniref:Uncharacterized protein n=1 Tax=Trema orientale TaxID=63057 RepID=A0A2P5EHW3_TREOI|nr:hypothetical protein TorRG33x02_191000 [Trema orientale]
MIRDNLKINISPLLGLFIRKKGRCEYQEQAWLRDHQDRLPTPKLSKLLLLTAKVPPFLVQKALYTNIFFHQRSTIQQNLLQKKGFDTMEQIHLKSSSHYDVYISILFFYRKKYLASS